MLDIKFSKKDYDKKPTADIYKMLAKDLGLWASEKIIFSKYLKTTDKILDIGCGAGRTTFGLFDMGYKNIVGVDLSSSMIENAKSINLERKNKIVFEEGNACELKYKNSNFDAVIFSFNGLMCIPNHENRMRALREIYRVLKQGGIFIFTAHDRDKDLKYKKYWEEENVKWDNGEQDSRLIDFGDRMIDSDINPQFVHISSYKETLKMIEEVNFVLIETKMKSEVCATPQKENIHFGETRFWIVRKG